MVTFALPSFTVAVATFGVPEDFCSENASFVYAFDVSTWERQSISAAPTLFEFDLDLDQNGTVDYAVFNQDLSGTANLSDGRNLAFALNVATGVATAFFFTDQNTNSANTVLYVCAEQLGLTLDDVGSSFDVAGFAVDFYTSGTVPDEVEFTAVFGGERYLGVVNGNQAGGGTVHYGAVSWRLHEDDLPATALLAAAFFTASSIHVPVGPSSAPLLLNGLVGVILGRRAALAIPAALVLQAALLGHGGFGPLGVNSCVLVLPALVCSWLFRWLHHPRVAPILLALGVVLIAFSVLVCCSAS